MNEMRNTHNHTLRRSVGAKLYSELPGHEKASLHKMFPHHIGEMVIEFPCKLEVKALPICFGRKEIEKQLIMEHEPIYNRKTKKANLDN